MFFLSICILGGTRTRDRACDSPPPSNGGQDCVGATTQSEDCNIEQCVRKLHWLPFVCLAFMHVFVVFC